MTFKRTSLTIGDGIGRLTFTNPARGNAIDGPACAELAEAAVVLSDDASVRAVLISAWRNSATAAVGFRPFA